MYFLKEADGRIKTAVQKEGLVFASACPAYIVCDGNEKKAAVVSETDNVVISEVNGIVFTDEYKACTEHIIKQ